MNRILMILVLMAGFFGQTVAQLPNSIPTTIGSNNTRVPGFLRADWGLLSTARDTTNKPTFPGIIFFSGDSAWYTWDMHKFTKIGTGSGGGGGSYTFTASDFNVSGSNVSLDYTNAQAASGSTKGFLTSADWLTFNGKVSSSDSATSATSYTTRGRLKKVADSLAALISGSGGGGGSIDTIRIKNDSISTNANVVATPIPFNSLRNKKLSLQGVTAMNMYGDSYTVGVGGAAGKGYADILPLSLGLPSTNYGVSGSGIYYSSGQANQTVNPSSNTKLLTLMTDLNDLRRSGDNLATYKKIRGGINSFISNNVIDSIFYMNNARITRYGAWTTFSPSAFGGKAGGAYGGLGLTTQTANDSLVYTCTGTNLIIQWLNSVIPGGSGGNFSLYIDNVLDTTVICDEADGITDGVNNNQTISGALLINDMGSGTHKIKIVNNGNNHLYLDYIAIPKAANRVAPMLIGLTPKMNAAGYTAYGGSDIAFSKGDSTILKTISAWSQFPVTAVYPMDYYNISYLSDDNIHPNTAGHALIAYAFADKFSPFLTASAATPYTASEGLSQVGYDTRFGGSISSNRTITNAINGNKYIEIGPTASYGDANVNGSGNALAKIKMEASNGAKGKVSLLDYNGNEFYSDGNQWVSGALVLAANNAIFSRQAKFEGFDGTADVSINGAGNSKDIFINATGVAIKGGGTVPNYALHVFGSGYVRDSVRVGKTPYVAAPDSIIVKTPGSTVLGAYPISLLGGGGIDTSDFNDLFDERFAALPGDTADTYPAAESAQFITSGGVYAYAQSGNYIFTLTNGANVTSSTFTKGRYIKVGNTVTYSGRLSVTLTAAYTNSVVSITIPIASDFTLADDCTGSMGSKDSGLSGTGVANVSTNKIDLQFLSNTLSGVMSIDFNLVYEIK